MRQPNIKPDSNSKEINKVLPNLLTYLQKNKIIELTTDNIAKVISTNSFFNLGYILFLLHIGSRINYKKKDGYFYFITTNAKDRIFVLKNNISKSSDFWLFYHDTPLYLQETLLFHSLFDEIYRIVTKEQDNYSTSIEQIASLIQLYKQNPTQLIKDEYEIIDVIEFPMDIINNILSLPQLDLSNKKIDPFQLFLYLYFRTKMKVVYLEAYDKNFENRIPWDVVAYDKNNSEKIFFIEITIGHTPKRLLRKFPTFLESIEKGEYLIYITPLKKLEQGIRKLLDHMQNQFPERFFVLDSTVATPITDINIGDKARKCYDSIIDQLNQIVELARKND